MGDAAGIAFIMFALVIGGGLIFAFGLLHGRQQAERETIYQYLLVQRANSKEEKEWAEELRTWAEDEKYEEMLT